MFANALVSALVNLLLLAGLPLLVYYGYHKFRKKRGFKEVAERAGLRLGKGRYVGYALLAAFGTVVVLFCWPPPLEPMTREGSAWRGFVGLGLGGQSVVMALLYGVVKTGFTEELLFRGLIAGSLSRRLSLVWANIWQSVIFLVPHLLILLVAPEMWGLLLLVFGFSLFAGWLRIKSESIIAPWLLHASLNAAMALSIAVRSA
jgi:membrane protease YdiL (CAAX protease family)